MFVFLLKHLIQWENYLRVVQKPVHHPFIHIRWVEAEKQVWHAGWWLWSRHLKFLFVLGKAPCWAEDWVCSCVSVNKNVWSLSQYTDRVCAHIALSEYRQPMNISHTDTQVLSKCLPFRSHPHDKTWQSYLNFVLCDLRLFFPAVLRSTN